MDQWVASHQRFGSFGRFRRNETLKPGAWMAILPIRKCVVEYPSIVSPL
jgi:hypothetical protein